MNDDDHIIPFGKHKGKKIEEVQIIEPGYLDWLEGQPWFRDKFVILHQTIINRGAEPEETPDHNALQVLFLDDAFCLKLVAALGYNPQAGFEAHRNKLLAESKDTLLRALAEAERFKSDSYSRLYKEHAEKQVQSARKYLAEYEAWSHRPSVEARGFEARGIDVVFEVPYAGRFRIEIKPVVGDDYPAILRQMKRLDANVLFLERYAGTGATREQFIAIFKSAGIAVIFRNQVGLT